MGKQSQIDKALASLRGERDVLDLAIRKLEAQQPVRLDAGLNAKRQLKPRKLRDAKGPAGSESA